MAHIFFHRCYQCHDTLPAPVEWKQGGPPRCEICRTPELLESINAILGDKTMDAEFFAALQRRKAYLEYLQRRKAAQANRKKVSPVR